MHKDLLAPVTPTGTMVWSAYLNLLIWTAPEYHGNLIVIERRPHIVRGIAVQPVRV